MTSFFSSEARNPYPNYTLERLPSTSSRVRARLRKQEDITTLLPCCVVALQKETIRQFSSISLVRAGPL
ncbi:hypothetical protein BHE90_010076 [Fusarium euwallaceae]|uniref:Uncharacterized protein n=1 Tax=Fusarium euwallaceae TaxID=1147111 RepID=A0A430LI87_9HYPO|nr:hypothetical protein BHE90_010076 [Fusarium euwallaceae]